MPFTPNLNLQRPLNASFVDVWDGPVNYNWDVLDALFADKGPYDAPPSTGHSHDGTAGQGPKVRHQDLSGAGILDHAAIDAGFYKAKVTVADTTPNYLASKIVAGPSGNVVLTVLAPGADEKLEVEVVAIPASFGDLADPSGEYGWKHFVPTSAPVAYTDNFNYPAQTSLVNCDYVVNKTSLLDFVATGYSAMAYVDPSKGDPLTDKYAATVVCHIPHGHAQRATISITEFDYSHLEPGDSVEFTLAVYSTHTLGAFLPQQLGVILEIHFTCTGVGAYNVTHRIFVLPDAVQKIQLFECHSHVNPDDIKGCWEISLDSNGHVYHYWRRQLVFSTQFSPPNIPGPVSAYFAALTASLTALGEPPYGAIGFGCQYAISMFSKFNLEARWFSATSNADIYDSVPPCPGVLPPIGVPSTVDLPEEFFFATPGGGNIGVPGAQCCIAPAVRVGDILMSDPLTGEPTVWVTQCAQIPIDVPVGSPQPIGFYSNLSTEVGFPCDIPAGAPSFYQVSPEWPQEGYTGSVIVHGIGPLPPRMIVTSSTIGFVIVDMVWLNWWEFLLKYIILDGYAGTPVILTITNEFVPAITFVVNPFVTITQRDPEITSVDWMSTYRNSLTVLLEGEEYEATIHGSGFNPDAVVTSSTPGEASVSGSTYVDPNTMTATVLVNHFKAPALLNLTVTNVAQAKSAIYDEAIGYAPPLISDVQALSSVTQGTAGVTLVLHGNFFEPGATVTDPDLNSVVNSFSRIDQHTINVDLDINGGTAGLDLRLQVTDSRPGSGLNATKTLCIINDAISPVIGGVTITPLPVYNAGRHTQYQIMVTPGIGFNESCTVSLSGYVVGEVNDTRADCRTTAAAVGSVVGTFYADCLMGPFNVDVTITKPGAGATTMLAAFPSAPPPLMVLGPGADVWNNGLAPGVSGHVVITPGAGLTHLSEISAIAPAYVVLTNRTITPLTLEYDYVVPTTAPENTPFVLTFRNGVCGATTPYGVSTEFIPPTIDSIKIDLHERLSPNDGYIYGEHFQLGAIVTGGGSFLVTGFLRISANKMSVTVTNGGPGVASLIVTNPDGNQDTFNTAVVAEVGPLSDHAELVPSTSGVNATLYAYFEHGAYLPGAVLTFVGFIPVLVVHQTDTYLEVQGLITAAPGNWITLDIASTSNPGGYGPMNLCKATAPGGGTVIIDSVSAPTIMENQIDAEIIIYGQNLDQVDFVEAIATDLFCQALRYQPIGPTIAVTPTITFKQPNMMVLNLDIKKGLAYNPFTLTFWALGPVLLATAPSAFKSTPAVQAPVISEATRLLLDAAIPTGAGVTWTATVHIEGAPFIQWMFGDVIVGAGFTVNWAVYNPLTGDWTVNGTNSPLPPPVNWQLTVSRPGVPPVEECNYRFPPGGVTT